MHRLNHPNIIKIFEAFESTSALYLVMEYVYGANLNSYLKRSQIKEGSKDQIKEQSKMSLLETRSDCLEESIAAKIIV